jgi:hypothetical protein
MIMTWSIIGLLYACRASEPTEIVQLSLNEVGACGEHIWARNSERTIRLLLRVDGNFPELTDTGGEIPLDFYDSDTLKLQFGWEFYGPSFCCGPNISPEEVYREYSAQNVEATFELYPIDGTWGEAPNITGDGRFTAETLRFQVSGAIYDLDGTTMQATMGCIDPDDIGGE